MTLGTASKSEGENPGAPPPLTLLPVRLRPMRRMPQLAIGLLLFGMSLGAMVRAGLGVNPWSVLYEGVGRYATALSFGTIGLIISLLVLLIWIPLRQRPGFGTFANVILVAVGSDFALAVLPESGNVVYNWTLLLGGIAVNGASIGIYVGARLGPGPRDGLMTGLSERFEGSIRLVRTGLELAVLAIGWLLGGTVGIGTVLYAVAVGPVTQYFLPLMVFRSPEELAAPAPAVEAEERTTV